MEEAVALCRCTHTEERDAHWPPVSPATLRTFTQGERERSCAAARASCFTENKLQLCVYSGARARLYSAQWAPASSAERSRRCMDLSLCNFTTIKDGFYINIYYHPHPRNLYFFKIPLPPKKVYYHSGVEMFGQIVISVYIHGPTYGYERARVFAHAHCTLHYIHTFVRVHSSILETRLRITLLICALNVLVKCTSS